MNITHFDDLLQAARQQPEPQRLLFVLTRPELPDDASAEQKAAFEAGHGGALVPVACVDRTPQELASFQAFATEAEPFCHDWVIVFAAGMAGRNGQAPSSESTQGPLEQMVAAIKAGQIGNFLPFDRSGDVIRLA
ncbi:MAG: hypothetical protein RLZZ555_1842 [Pseudomonadota bacterium]|jgi:hypothetical protein